MPSLHRIPEGRKVDKESVTVFSNVARWGEFTAAKRVQKIIGSYMVPGMKVLDIGTGPAAIPLYLKRLFPEVCFTGLDVSIAMLEKAKENRKILGTAIHLCAGDGITLPLRSNSVDIITVFFALHHMDEPAVVLREIQRVLKSDGLLLSIDFRRDMPGLLYRVLDVLWQGMFFFSSGRFGLRESIQASWNPDEINQLLEENALERFLVHTNWMELWIYKGLQ